jgi:WhiB family transcriptional regulator, redox-sensing transcriptional regulator
MTEVVVEEMGSNSISFPTLRHVMSLDWRGQAMCGRLPKSTFFDYNSLGLKKKEKERRIKVAMSACNACPVRIKCYEFSVLNNEPYGIWAGTFPEDRRKLFASFRKTGILEPLPTA